MTLPRAVPLYFGPEGRSLFGWLHPAADPAASRAVLICNPFGYEALCAHRSLRNLAESIARSGVSAMRFDYFAAGDSSGSETDRDLVEAWVVSVGSALDELKRLTGVSRVCLVGLRLGATLAVMAAQGRSDIAGLVAIAPVVKPRAYLRELRALALTGEVPTPPEGVQVDADLQEAAGFGLTAQTREALAKIDLTSMPSMPAPRVLILERNDLPADPSLGAHWQALGATVERRQFTGYTEMMLDAHRTVVPTAMIDAVVGWIGLENNGARDGEVTTYPVSNVALLEDARVRETAVWLDGERSLFGILAEPADTAVSARQVVLLLNSGAVSHVGPGRLYVTLARHLARRGAVVLRVDISGIGDSYPHAGEPENSVYTSRAAGDIQTCFDYLRQHFVGARYHALGICLGAYHAFKAVVAGLPFQSAVLINPLTFFWKEGMSLAQPAFVAAESARYRANMLRPSAWLKVLRGKVNLRGVLRTLTHRAKHLTMSALYELARFFRLRLADDLAAELVQATNHSAQLLFVFSSSDPGQTLLREQGGFAVARLVRQGDLKIEIIEGADHTFTPHWARSELLSVLTAHLKTSGESPGASS